MIPKKIHYCWFGGNPLPALAKRCISSWKKYLPDYEIIEWNESNYDVHKIPYISEAYNAKKYAFVSDYARFDILYNHGGLYFDIDVEVLDSLDDIIKDGPFMGIEQPKRGHEDNIFVAPGLGLGVTPGLGLYKEILDSYASLHFVNPDGSLNTTTVVAYTTNILKAHGFNGHNHKQRVANITIYPWQVFCPMEFYSNDVTITPETKTIHLYNASWVSKKNKINHWISRNLGNSALQTGVKIKAILRKIGLIH